MKRLLNILAIVILVTAIATFVWLRQRTETVEQRRPEVLAGQANTIEQAVNDEAPLTGPIVEETPPGPPAPTISSKPAKAGTAPHPAMLQDPETRALMRKQQEQALIRGADRIISKEFVQDWNLAPEQVSRIKELFRERTAAGKDLLMAMMFDGLDDDALAQRGRETKQRIEDSNTGLRALLGTDGFDALREKERSMEERDRLKRIREEFALAEIPLSKPQQDSLLEAMSAERQAFTFRVDYSDPSKVDMERVRDHFSEQNLQMYYEDMQQLNARIAERATLFLSAEQLEKLRSAQSSHLDQARLTVKMTTELFNRRRAN